MNTWSPDEYLSRAEKVLAAFGGLFTFSDIIERINDGRMQSFTRNNTLIVTQINEYPRRKVVEIVLLVGDVEDALEMEHDVQEWALNAGATLLMAAGRFGWEPLMTDGWKAVSANYVKDIGHGA